MFYIPLAVMQEQFGVDPALSDCLGCASCRSLELSPVQPAILVCTFNARRHLIGEFCKDYSAAKVSG